MTFEVSLHLPEQRMMPLNSVQLFSALLAVTLWLKLLHHLLREGLNPQSGSFVIY